ncbi:SOS-response transcriptional repressor LexA [Ancylobacter sp. 3268]|uniref:LexA family protein n=1 Tax=Ancylobacter sp. 3268 TaxID=2817752 RepID=UPI002859CAC0|nr:S24 family peptidase [Ancylobacter sp. 3268]MDR6952322.1 SOS-response transcriptional repressor LexA [Ancylobacter sp. 3268]
MRTDQATLRRWLAEQLEERGHGAKKALADHLGVRSDAITRMINEDPNKENREIRWEEVPKIAAFFRTDPPVALPSLAPQGLKIPLISWVSAGAMQTPEAVHEIEDAEKLDDPGLDPSGEWVALTVVGDSMDRISPPDSIIFVNLRDQRLVANACYVIVDAETGEATYKRWRPSPERWEPVSTNPIHEPIFVRQGRAPRVIGRVRKSVLGM